LKSTCNRFSHHTPIQQKDKVIFVTGASPLSARSASPRMRSGIKTLRPVDVEPAGGLVLKWALCGANSGIKDSLFPLILDITSFDLAQNQAYNLLLSNGILISLFTGNLTSAQKIVLKKPVKP
jgi:hypothetical protein